MTTNENLNGPEKVLLEKIAQKTLDNTGVKVEIITLINAIHNPELFSMVWSELNQAVGLLNRHISGQEIQSENPVPLNYADDMKAAMTKHHIPSLPSPNQILEQVRNSQSLDIIRHLIRVFNKTKNYSFLSDFDTQQALSGEAMAVYGKLLLELHPSLKKENVFGASTLEEMFAVLKFNGIDTHCYHATKSWFLEEEEGTPGIDGRGFSHALVEKVKKFSNTA